MAFAGCSSSSESCIPGIQSSPCRVSSPPTASSPDAASARAGSSPARSAVALPWPATPSRTSRRNHRHIGPVPQAGYTAPPRSDPICSGRCSPAAVRSLRLAVFPPASASPSRLPSLPPPTTGVLTSTPADPRSAPSPTPSGCPAGCCQSSLECPHPLPPRHRCCALASMLPTRRHSCRSGHTTHGIVVSCSAWHTPIACVGVVALFHGGFWPSPACPRAYLLTSRSKQGPFPPARYVARLLRYYGPLGLPPGSARFQPSGLIRAIF